MAVKLKEYIPKVEIVQPEQPIKQPKPYAQQVKERAGLNTVLATLENIYPEKFVKGGEFSPDEDPATILNKLYSKALNQPDVFITEIKSKGRNENTLALLDAFGVPDEAKGEIFPELPPVEKLPSLTWLDKVEEIRNQPIKLIPFVSSGVEIYTLGKLMKTALDLEAGREVSKEDLLALKAYVDRSTMDTTWGYEVADVITQLVPFAGEFIATGGIFSTGKTATVKVAEQALKRIATKTGLRILEGKLAKYGVEVAGVVTGGTLRAIPAGITRIPASTLEKQLQGTLTGDEESVWRSLLKATGEQWVEIVSESTGGLFAPLTAPVKGQLVKLGLFKAFQTANPGKSANDINRILTRMGYSGVIGEMLEERVAGVMHGVLQPLGLSDQKFSIPSLQQLSVELVSFSIPGVAAQAVQATPAIIEKLSPSIKKAIAEAAAEYKIAPERGAITLPGKPEEIKPPVLTEQIWNTMEVSDRALLARHAGLEGKVGSKEWTNLTTQEQDAIRLAREEIAPAKVTPVTPEVTKLDAARNEIKLELEYAQKRVLELRENLKVKGGTKANRIWQNNELGRNNTLVAEYKRILSENNPEELIKYAPKEPTAIPKAEAPVAPEVTEPIRLTVYRGESELTPVDKGIFGQGRTFSTNRDIAQRYAGEKGNVLKEVVNLKNPYIIDATTSKGITQAEAFAKRSAAVTTPELKAAGYDGVIVKGWHGDKGDEVVVFYPDIAIPKAEVTLYRGEPIGIRPTTAGGVPFTPDIVVAQGWAGQKGRVVQISMTREEFDKIPFQQLPDRVVTYRVPQDVYEKATAIPKAEAGMPEAGYQPAMIEGVTEKEVRPKGKGIVTQISMEEQLKLQQARRAAEEAPAEVKEAYEAQAEIEGIKTTHQTDPVAQARFKLGGRNVDLTAFISIREQNFPEYFTIKQAQAIKPNINLIPYTQKGTKLYNHIPKGDVLDELGAKWGMTEDEIANRVMQIRREKATLREAQETIKRQMTERPLEPQTELTTEEVAEQWQTLGITKPKYNIKQIDALNAVFADYINQPSTLTAWELTRELRRETRAGMAENLKARTQELIVSKGIGAEEAMKQAIKDTLSGELPAVTTEYLEGLTNDMRDCLFAKVAIVLKDDPYEMASTFTALTKALTGRPIPREKPIAPPGGFRSRIWPQGASAYDKLQYVFGDQPKVLKAIDKMASEKKPLQDVVEGIYHETGREPIPVDQKTADYLRALAEIPMGQARLGEKPFVIPSLPVDTRTAMQKRIDLENFKLELTEDIWKNWTPVHLEEMSYLRVNLLKTEYQTRLGEMGWTPPPITDKRTAAQRALELDLFKIEMAPAPIGVTHPVYEAPIEDVFKAGQLWPRPVRDNIIRALKELGMLPVDIGNFLRANKASVDFSFWRQQAPLIARHPIAFAQANVEAWRALWSQKSAEASWQRITRDPIYQIYEEAERQGGDFLRPLELKKGTSQYKGTEEYGYSKGVGRMLPQLTAALPWVKLSARAFETGTNVHNWLIFKSYYSAMLKYSEQIASGQKKLKAGEAFDITKEMVDFSKSLANFTGRGSLGKFAATAPELSGLFFAPRLAVGRILSVKDLINANPRVRLEAWKNAASFVGTFGGLVLLGAAMGWWEVEKDPRNAEYMSIRIGNTRIDPWGGYRQFLVFFARAINLTGVSSVTGAEYEVDPINLIQTFIRGKASPLASLILDFWRGKNFIGEEVDVANKAQWVERVAPFAVWDIYEAYKDDPIHAVQVTIPAIVGAGVQTYTGDWKENFPKLGLPEYTENLAYGLTDPKYDTADFWADTAHQFKDVDPSTVTVSKGYPEYIRAITEARVISEHLATLPSEKLVSLNADPGKGTTFADYYKMWRDRQAIVDSDDEETLKEFDKKYPKAELGNFSQRQFALLNEYWSITDKKKQAEFLEKNKAEIGVNQRNEYLRSHPKENAQLAVWGQADILTKEAYNQFIGLLKTMDIPDSAIPELTLPPKDSIDTHFSYLESVEKTSANSWESQLIKAKDPEYCKWASLELPDSPIAALELKVKNRKLYDTMDSYSDKDSPQYIADEKERAKVVAKLKADNPVWVDDMRRIEAIENKTPDDKTTEAWVDRGHTIDQFGVGSSEAKVWLLDHPEVHKWALDNELLTDDGKDWNVPVLRINVQFAKQDDAYNALPDDAKIRTDYLTKNTDYRIARRQRDFYGLNTPLVTNLVLRDKYVGFYESSDKGYVKEHYRLDNPDLDAILTNPAIMGNNVLSKIDQTKVPDKRYDQIYLEFQDLFDEWDSYGLGKSPNYIADSDERQRTRESLLARNPDFKRARWEQDAYLLFIGQEKFVPDYLGYKDITDKGKPAGQDYWFEDDWFLLDHPEFYKAMVEKEQWQAKDFSRVPTKAIFQLYQIYDNIIGDSKTSRAEARRDFRRRHPDFDAWLVIIGAVSKPIEEYDLEQGMTEAERIGMTLAEKRAAIDKLKREIEEKLKAMK